MKTNNKRVVRRPKRDEEEEVMSFLQYDGGAKSQASKKSKEPEVKYHCCCKYSSAIVVYGVLLWILGILVISNILVQFQNKYLPKWYPIIGLIISLVYVAALILISSWFCKDGYGTRTSLKLAGFLILGAIVVLIILCLILVLFWDKEHENIKVGNGDDDSDYADYPRGWFFLEYLIGGVVIIGIDLYFMLLVNGYVDSFPPEEDTSPEEEKKMMSAM